MNARLTVAAARQKASDLTDDLRQWPKEQMPEKWELRRWMNVARAVPLWDRDMPSELERAERWRKLAARALVVANELTDPEARKIMLGIAAEYEHLARRAEARGDDKASK